MFGLFRRQLEPELTVDEVRAIRQDEAVQRVKDAIDVINDEIPHLPYGVRPWMDWSDPPPRLKLKHRRYERDTILHG